MDHYDVQPKKKEKKHKGRNVVWSTAMDKCLIEALAVQARNGNKVAKSFNENAYTAACVAVNNRFHLNLNNQKITNRLKTIKKRYRIVRDMLTQNGFRWNSKTKMIECDNHDVWKRYIAAHPDAKGLRVKQVEMMYEDLKIVCGDYQPPTRWAKMKNESRPIDIKIEENSASFVSPSSEDDPSDTDGTESYTQDPLPKRARSSDALQDAMLTVASSIRHLADAMEQSKTTISSTELLEAVMEIDGLDEGKQMYAFEYLNADPVKARAFLTYNARMRKIYLCRQFWWWKYVFYFQFLVYRLFGVLEDLYRYYY